MVLELRDQIDTSYPLFAAISARTVPQEPDPKIPILLFLSFI